MATEIRRLRPDDDRSPFRSGSIDLDRFFQRFAGQNQFRHHIGVTYVAVQDGTILGFATVSAAQIAAEHLAARERKKLPNYPLPALRLARLAVDERAQGKGIGAELLRFVLILARRMAEDLGCVGVLVDAKPGAVRFYERYGFEQLTVIKGHLGDRPEPATLFLEMGAIPKE